MLDDAGGQEDDDDDDEDETEAEVSDGVNFRIDFSGVAFWLFMTVLVMLLFKKCHGLTLW